MQSLVYCAPTTTALSAPSKLSTLLSHIGANNKFKALALLAKLVVSSCSAILYFGPSHCAIEEEMSSTVKRKSTVHFQMSENDEGISINQ